MIAACSVPGPGNFPVSVLLNGTNLVRGRHLSLLTPFLKCCPHTTLRISSYSSHTQCFELRRVGGILDFAVIRQTTFLSLQFASCFSNSQSLSVTTISHKFLGHLYARSGPSVNALLRRSVEETIFRLVLIIP